MDPEGIFVPVELKVVRRGRKIDLSPHQVAFHVKHAAMHCPTFILVEYHPPGTISARKAELLLYRGSQALELINAGIDATPLDRWSYAAPMWHMLRMHFADSWQLSKPMVIFSDLRTVRSALRKWEKTMAPSCVTLGFKREDLNFQVLATLNNNDGLISDASFSQLIEDVSEKLAALVLEPITVLDRQDVPDYLDPDL